MDLVSIIVPIYNTEMYLERCLDSLVNQTYKNIEVVMIDDGSTDDSSQICHKYEDKDNRFKYVYQKNAGVSAARNHGLKIASGEYVAFCDSDDWMDEDYIEKLYTATKVSKADGSIGGYRFHDGNREILSFTIPETETLTIKELTDAFWQLQNQQLLNSTCNKLYRRELIKHQFDESMTCGEDMCFNMQYLLNAKSITLAATVGYNYYKPKTSYIKYPKNNATQCLAYSESVREFLASALTEDEYITDYETFFCCNICRDVCTIAAANDFETSKRMIKEFLDMPEMVRVLKHNAFKGKGRKYEIVGNLLKQGIVSPIILGVKLFK